MRECASRCRAQSATGSVAPRHVALRCNRYFSSLNRCTALQQEERRPVLQQNYSLLQHAMRCNNGWATVSFASSHKPAERCCNTRCTVATDGQPCRLRRRTNLLNDVATRDAPLQRMGNRDGCVVARTCCALLQHAVRWATEIRTARPPRWSFLGGTLLS